MHDHDETPHLRHLFSELWSLHHRAVYQGCLSWLDGRADDADEAYSRVAIRAFERCPDAFRDQEHARAWLLALARNICMDLHRERRRGREVSMDDEPHTADRSAGGDPESTYLLDERDRHLHALVRGLPSRLRRIVELHIFGEMTYDEVARELGISVVNVRKRMQEVRRRMREEIESGLPPDEEAIVCEELDAEEDRGGVRTLVTVQTRTPHLDERDAILVIPLAARPDEQRIAWLQRYCEKHPRGWRRRLDLARALAAAGRVDEAVAHYRYVTTRQPFPLEHWLELGAALEALGRRSEAASAYERGAIEAGRETARHHLRALALALRDDVDGARELLARAADTDVHDARHARAYGAICLEAGRPGEAVQALERALSLDPADPLTPLLLHDALIEAGRPAAALEHAAAAVDADPSNVPALERFVAARARAGAVDGDLVRAMLHLAPDRGRVHAVVAQVALLRGRPAEAEARALLYQSRHARHAGAWLALAGVHLGTGEVGAALEAALKALTLRPDDRTIWLELCRILPLAGEPEEAQRAVGEIRLRFANDAILLGAAGAVAVAAEDRPRALELCARAVDLQPDLPSLRLQYASVLADAGRYGEALGELSIAWTIAPADDGHLEAARVALLLARLHRCTGTAALSCGWASVTAERARAAAALDPAAALALHGAASELLGNAAGAWDDYHAALAHGVVHPLRGEVVMALRRLDGSQSGGNKITDEHAGACMD